MIKYDNFAALVKRSLRFLKSGQGMPTTPPSFAMLCDQAVLRCLAAGNMTWIENAFGANSYPNEEDAVRALRHLVVRHLLREAGDAEGAAHLLEGLRDHGAPEDPSEEFFRLLSGYAARELQATVRRLPVGPGEHFAISLVMWGDHYIDRFQRYCLASLSAAGNIPALKARGRVTLLVHTTARDAPKIRRLEALHRLGIRLRIWIIPDDLLRLAVGDMKYWMLGAIQSVHLFHAAQRRAHFLPIFPEVLVSVRYFESLLDAGGKGTGAVFLSAFRAWREGMTPQLAGFLKDGVYAVPSANLVELSLRHIHEYIRHCFIDPRSQTIPERRMLWAHGGDYLEVRSPHYNAALIRNSLIAPLKPRYLMTLDSEIDKILPTSSKIHFRSIDDEYFATELMDERTEPPRQVGLDEYAQFFVGHTKASHLRFYNSPYRIGIRPEWLQGATPFPSQELTTYFERIVNVVEERMRLSQHFERPNLVMAVLRKLEEADLTLVERERVMRARQIIQQSAA